MIIQTMENNAYTGHSESCPCMCLTFPIFLQINVLKNEQNAYKMATMSRPRIPIVCVNILTVNLK